MTTMIIARGDITEDKPHIYTATVPTDTYRLFKEDRAWTCNSFGKRILTVAIPGTMDYQAKIAKDWGMIREMIAKSPALFDSMIRDKPKSYLNVSK
jgi:hypothetical protein